jgi:hypothetical protein
VVPSITICHGLSPALLYGSSGRRTPHLASDNECAGLDGKPSSENPADYKPQADWEDLADRWTDDAIHLCDFPMLPAAAIPVFQLILSNRVWI